MSAPVVTLGNFSIMGPVMALISSGTLVFFGDTKSAGLNMSV
jgi:hypothetical protein